MKTKPKMYVRTKDGIIGKYNVVKEWIDVPTVNGYYEIKEIEREYIDNKLYGNYVVVKASYSIIDLIQLGDYVNGHKVYETGVFEHNGKSFCKLYGNVAPLYEEDIRSIVTKEAFESVKYEVK